MKKLISSLSLILLSNFALATSPALDPWQKVSSEETNSAPVMLVISQIKNLIDECKGDADFIQNEVEESAYFTDYKISVSCHMDYNSNKSFPSVVNIQAVIGQTKSSGELFIVDFNSSFSQAVPSGVSIGTK
jgi:hypothetical protein